MNELASIPLTMSSLEIAGLCGKRHDHVLRDADKMLEELGLGGDPRFGASYLSEQGKALRCLKLPKRESLILVSGYSVEMRARIIDRWMELEAAIAAPALSCDADLSRVALNAVGGIVKSGNGVQTREIQAIIAESVALLLPAAVGAAIMKDGRRAVLAYVPSLDLAREAGAVQKGRGHLSRRIGRALCALDKDEAKRFRCATTGHWLFDRQFAKDFMRHVGNAWVSDHNAAQSGQGVFPFKRPQPSGQSNGVNP